MLFNLVSAINAFSQPIKKLFILRSHFILNNSFLETIAIFIAENNIANFVIF